MMTYSNCFSSLPISFSFGLFYSMTQRRSFPFQLTEDKSAPIHAGLQFILKGLALHFFMCMLASVSFSAAEALMV